MNVHKLIQKRLRGKGLAGQLDAAIAANVGEPGERTTTRVSSHHRIVQQGGRTVVDEHEVRTGDTADPQPTDTPRS
jgi:hypothetical protein